MQGEENPNLKEVFDSFDADKSGFIELNELDKVAKELGAPVPQDKLQEII